MEWFQLGMAGLQGLAGAFRGRAEREAGRQARQTAYYNASALDREADALDAESAENQMRMRAMQGVATGQAAAQTAASGSALGREMKVATRFEQEVNDLAARSLQRSSAMREQAQMERWKGRQAERAGKVSGFGSLLSGVVQGGATAFNAFK